ncbi:hypothetical protein N9R09_00295 [Porticoccaceae bacterium]|nr:hypothetical protein [Porticoccaceae bacterium]
MSVSDFVPSMEDFTNYLLSSQFGPELGCIASKFVQDMLRGIHRTRSVNLTYIAKELGEPIRLHATHKRLSRNLENPFLADQLSDRLLKMSASHVRPETRLIVHMSTLSRKYARKVEYLSNVGDGLNSGFKFCEILASNPDSDIYTPLHTRVWSDQVPGFISDADEIKKTIGRVLGATGNTGMVYIDDVTLQNVGLLCPIMQEPSVKFVVSPELGMELIHKNKHCKLDALAKTVETSYGKILFKLIPEGIAGASKNTDMDLFMHAGALAVKLPECNRNLRLISIKTKSRFLGETLTPLVTSETNLRSRKMLMGLVESWLSVQDVRLTHAALRKRFEPDSFRVLTYNRLKLLMILLQTVLQYESSKGGGAPVNDHRFSRQPHRGDVERTYLLPG